MISNIIRVLGIVVFVILFFQIMFLDSYPKMNDNIKSIPEIENFISTNIEHNVKKLTFEYMDDKDKIRKSEIEFQKFVVNINKCKNNPECMIESYNDYMSDNIVPSLRKRHKAEQMYSIYGMYFGSMINDTLGIFY